MPVNIEPFYRELGRRIREKRTKKKLTQEQLGRLLDPQVTRASIANIESGSQRVLAHTLAQIVYHLGGTFEELLPPIDPEKLQIQSADLIRELNRQLDITAKQAQELFRKLKKNPQGKGKHEPLPS